MKRCERCGEREATVHYKETIGTSTKEMYLCPQCAARLSKENELFSESVFGLFPSFSSFEKKERGDVCPLCGTDLQSLRRKGKFGCSGCFDTFGNLLDLSPFVGSGYRGGRLTAEKTSRAEEKAPSAEDVLVRLRRRLSEAVAEERYEEAAKIRDEIREKEGK